MFAALTSQQWPVKAQAVRVIGTVATKLDTNIQARLVSLLLAGLEGRTWAGKEALMKSLADIVKFAPDTLKAGMAVEEQDKLVEVHTGPNQTTRLQSSLRWRRSASLSESFREDKNYF